MQIPGELLARRSDVAHVRILRFPQRSRYTDIDRIQLRKHAEVGRSSQVPAAREFLHVGTLDIEYVRVATVDSLDFCVINIDAGDAKARLSELHSERQADIAETDDSNGGS